MQYFIGAVRSWLICLVPQFVCVWLWDRAERTGKPLGPWAPHVFGKMMGVTSWRRLTKGEAGAEPDNDNDNDKDFS